MNKKFGVVFLVGTCVGIMQAAIYNIDTLARGWQILICALLYMVIRQALKAFIDII